MGVVAKLRSLCKEKGISFNQFELQSDVGRGTAGKWDKNKPSIEKIKKTATFLEVPVDFLLEAPPFDCWELINQNRKGFLHYAGISPDKLRVIWNIDADNPDASSIKEFASFLSMAVESARPTEEGDWEIKLKDPYKNNQSSTSDGEERRQISDDDLMFALWGDATDITDEDLEDVKRFAAFVRERKKKE